MSTENEKLIAEIARRAEKATTGPWEYGDRQMVAGVMSERYGEGKCAYCNHGEPSWIGKRSINGSRMLAHVHTAEEPTYRAGILALRESGSWSVVIETDEYGLMCEADGEFIAHARADIPFLLTQLATVTKAADELQARVDAALAVPITYYSEDGQHQMHTALTTPAAQVEVEDVTAFVKVTRVEVIDNSSQRAFTQHYRTVGVEVHIQDDGRTLKVFAGTKEGTR